MAAFSLRGHRCLDLLPCRRRSGVACRRGHPNRSLGPGRRSAVPPAPASGRAGRTTVLHAHVARALFQVRSDLLQPERPRNPERPRERLAALREIDASQIGVHMGAPARHPTANIREELPADYDDTQQARPRRPGSTTDTGTNRSRVLERTPLGVRTWCSVGGHSRTRVCRTTELCRTTGLCKSTRQNDSALHGNRLRTARHIESIPLRPESGRPSRRTSEARSPSPDDGGPPRPAAPRAARYPRCRSGCRSAIR